MKKNKLINIRKEYNKDVLHSYNLKSSPFQQLKVWFDDYMKFNKYELNSVVLSTVSHEGVVSSRVVLLKKIKKKSLIFFTNYNSQKAKDIEFNKSVALCIYWPEMERQVNIQGFAHKTSKKESVSYFNSRPIESRISAIISNQSQKIPFRKNLEKAFLKLKKSNSLECPSHWGGYEIIPNRFEFWQGRKYRLHDRFEYKIEINNWSISRLSP